MSIPVYLVDEEIYAKCPPSFCQLLISLRGYRDVYVAIGAEHGRHNRTASLQASTITHIRPFLPSELIIQDEFNHITGPLGTVYGAYETIIENMCIHDGIKPKRTLCPDTCGNISVALSM